MLIYPRPRYEDPNCLLVIELVANEVDKHKDITLGSYGCGWTFIQVIIEYTPALFFFLHDVPFNDITALINYCVYNLLL